MSILSDLTSKDADRIYSGACEVRLLRNREELKMLVEHLSEIRKLTSNIPLGGALYPNIAHLKFAIKKLEFVKYSKDCLCILYSEDQFYNPEVEQNIGNIRILSLAFYFICLNLSLLKGFFMVHEYERRAETDGKE